MTRTLGFALFGFLSLAGLSTPVRADDACAADRERLCGASKGPQKMACMKSHEGELSEPCKAQRGMVKQAGHELHADCKADVARLCQGVQHGGGAVRECLKTHQAELSPACAQAEAKLIELKETIHPGCHSDVDKFCKGTQNGGGRILACLASHHPELTPACQAKVEKREAKAAARAGAPAPAPAPAGVAPAPVAAPPPPVAAPPAAH